ncbi:MAG: MerR family transcriptional regulator [Candidatus Muproteobacteria bacterium RBG_16_64_10]|uniref:Mercuric resistance operon regulatory protein n=1 Tax=Candidatus Muproteobacteria bacterium RBG_16_64_10 TaxID=1817757 RepID=A0A1F6SZC2_9PROT|nr:MAG: MerR family transcriptional regulator [Candidatus Muproteobacteria bacterium RBG_16_64_10]
MDDKTFTIGALARTAGVNVETIRYYQRRGLLPKPGKPVAGYRRYPADTLARLRFIQRAQELGFTLREIGELLALGGGSCRETQRLAEHKRADIAARIRDLQSMRRALDRLLRACHRGGRAACPIIESLYRGK